MSVQNLINDFILEKTQEAPSEEKINAIVSNYGDNTDALINDLFMEFKGEAPAPDQLNQIKSTYLSDQPVKKKDESISEVEVMDSELPGGEQIISSESSEVVQETSTPEPSQSVTPQPPETTVEVEEEETVVEEQDPPKIPPAPERVGSIYVNEETGELSPEPFTEGQAPSTHLMRAEQLEDGSWVAFPSLFQDANGQWINMSNEDDWTKTYERAKLSNEVIEFGDDKESAIAYGKGSWKTAGTEEEKKPRTNEEILADMKADGYSQDQIDAYEVLLEGMDPMGEKPTFLEYTYGKNIFTDLVSDIWRSGAQGWYQGNSVPEAMNMIWEGSGISDEELQEYIDAVRKSEAPPSREMQDFMQTYKEEGGGVFGWLKGVYENPSILPQIFTSSTTSWLSTVLDPKVAAATGTTALGTGLVGAAAGGPLAPVTFTGGAIAGGIGMSTAIMETGLTFTELLKEELGDKPFTRENVRAILNDPEKFNSLRYRAAARGGTIGVISGISGNLATGAARNVAVKTGKPLLAVGASTAVEGGSGAVSEVAGRAVAGQEQDVAETLFEATGNLPGTAVTAPFGLSQANKIIKAQQPSYAIGNQKVSKQFMEGVIRDMTLEDAEVSNTKLTVENDPELKAKLDEKMQFLENEKNVRGPYSAADRSKIAALTTELDNTPDVIGNEVRRNEIQNEIKSIQEKYVVSDAEVDAEIARMIEDGEKTSDVTTTEEREIVRKKLQQQKNAQNQMDVSETETTVDEFGNVIETKNLDIQITDDFVLEKLNEDGITNPTDEQIKTKKQELIEEARKIAEQQSETEVVTEAEVVTEDRVVGSDPNLVSEETTTEETTTPQTQEDAVQESSTEGVSVQESPGDSQTVVEGVSESEVTPQETTQEEVEAEVTQDEKVDDKKPRTSKVDEGPKRGYQIDKDLDEIVATDKAEEDKTRKGPMTLLEREEQKKQKRQSLRDKLKEKGYKDRQIDLAIARKDRQALQELKNLKKDLQEQGKAQKKYTVKATKEFKQTLRDIINGMASEKNIKFTKGQLNKILDAATGTEMQGLDVDAAIDKAIVEVEKSVRKAYITDINTKMKKDAVQFSNKKGKNRGKIDVEQRRLWNDYLNTYSKEDINNMTIDELQALDEELNTILEGGKANLDNIKKLKFYESSRTKGNIEEGLYRNEKATVMDTESQTRQFLKQNQNNFVIIDGQEINGVTAFDNYMNANKGKGFTAKGYTAPTGEQVNYKRSWLDKASSWGRKIAKDWQTIDRLTEKLKRRGGPRVRKAIDKLTNTTLDAEVDRINGEAYMASKMEEYVNKAGVGPRKLNQKSNVDYAGKKLTNNEVAYMYAMQRINGKQSLINTGVNPSQVDAYIEANPELKQLAEDLAAFMKDEAVPRYRSTYEQLTGLPFEDSEFYISTLREGTDDVSMTDKLIDQEGNYTGKTIMADYMKPKTDNNNPLKIRGITDVVSDYVIQMERTMAYLPAAELYGNTFSKNTVGQMGNILGTGGPQDVNTIMQTYDEAILGKRRSGPSDPWAKYVMNPFVIKTLALNPKLLRGQALSGTHFYALATTNPEYGVSTKDVIKAFGDMFSPKKEITNEQKGEDVFFLQKFVTEPVWKDRWKRIGIDPTLQKYQTKDGNKLGEAYNKLVDIAMMGLKTGDMMGAWGGLPVAKAMYNNYRAAGMEPNAAYDKAFKNYYKLVTKYQQTTNALFKPGYSSKAYGQILAPYTSALNANANELSVTIQKFRDPTLFNNGKDVYNNLMRLAYLAGPAVGLFNLVQGDYFEEGKELENRMNAVPEATDERQIQKDRLYGLGANTAQSLIGGYGPTGAPINYLMHWGRGRPQSFSQPFILTEYQNFANAMSPLLEYFGDKEWEDLTEAEQKKIIKLGGRVMKFPEELKTLFKNEITLGDFMQGRGPSYGYENKLGRYDKDAIRNWAFGFDEIYAPESKGESEFDQPSEFRKSQFNQ